MAVINGEDASSLIDNAIAAGVAAVIDHTELLSRKVTMKSVRKMITEQIQSEEELAQRCA